ncbi:MAG: hypothetical protein JKY94_17650 [Rhodobacteraceae bacterium]|nr:hypothetical protein [Paracoccaceae bacterium]
MTSVSFPAHYLHDAYKFVAGLKDPRTYLQSVHVEIPPGAEFATLVATNGNSMGIFRVPLTAPSELLKGGTVFNLVLPQDPLKRCKQAKKKEEDLDVSICLLTGETHLDGKTIINTVHVVKFPDWRNVLRPLTGAKPGATRRVDIALLSEIASVDPSDKPGVVQMARHGEDGVMTVSLASRPDFFGLLMPVHVESEGHGYPTTANNQPFEVAL